MYRLGTLGVVLLAVGTVCLGAKETPAGKPADKTSAVLGFAPTQAGDGAKGPGLGFLPELPPRPEAKPKSEAKAKPETRAKPEARLPAMPILPAPTAWTVQEMRPFLCEQEMPQRFGSPLWLEGDYLLWWISDSHTPPLVTTGPVASQGILGQAGTTVLFGGNIDNEAHSGGRFSTGLWLDDCHRRGLEAGMLFLGERSVHFGVASPGDPLFARPFFNAATGQQDAEQIASLRVPGRPDVLPLNGRLSIDSSTQLWGLEANGVGVLWRTCDFDLRGLFGFRFLSLDESLVFHQDVLVQPGSPDFAGDRFRVMEDFGARNEFYGGQVGSRLRLYHGLWTVDLLGKVAVGTTHQTVAIQGGTEIDRAGGLAQHYLGGLLAQPTNIGLYHRDRFGVIPEFGITTGVHLTSHLDATIGYTGLYWSGVARPGDQIDRAVNETLIPPASLRGQARPVYVFHERPFWAHGLNLGLQFNY